MLATPRSSSAHPVRPIAPTTLLAFCAGVSICPNGADEPPTDCCTVRFTVTNTGFAPLAEIMMVELRLVDPPITLPGLTMATEKVFKPVCDVPFEICTHD